MTALVACGLIAGEGPEASARPASLTPRPGESHGASGHSRRAEDLTVQVRELEREVGEWRRRAEVAEARAEERGRALDALRMANETERLALRMLTAGTFTSTALPPQPAQEQTPSAERAAPTPGSPPSAPAAHPHASSQKEPPRKGFFSRVMGL